MADMDNKEMDGTATTEAIKVNIFDQLYSLRSPKGEEHIRQLAQLVDERMRQIAEHTTTFELSRIAVLAALNIADELSNLKAQGEETQASPSTSSESSNQSDTETSHDRAGNDEAGKAQTWFEAIFDAEVPVKDRSERLSSQISSKLQTSRHEDSKPSGITAEEDND